MIDLWRQMNVTCVVRLCHFILLQRCSIHLFATQFNSRRASSLMRKHMKKYSHQQDEWICRESDKVIDSYDDEDDELWYKYNLSLMFVSYSHPQIKLSSGIQPTKGTPWSLLSFQISLFSSHIAPYSFTNHMHCRKQYKDGNKQSPPLCSISTTSYHNTNMSKSKWANLFTRSATDDEPSNPRHDRRPSHASSCCSINTAAEDMWSDTECNTKKHKHTRTRLIPSLFRRRGSNTSTSSSCSSFDAEEQGTCEKNMRQLNSLLDLALDEVKREILF